MGEGPFEFPPLRAGDTPQTFANRKRFLQDVPTGGTAFRLQ